MKNTFVKVLSFVMALMMVVGTFSTLAVFAEDEHEHTKDKLIEAKDPNCTDYGVTLWECECGERWSEITSQPVEGKHVWKEIEAKDATCLNPETAAGRKCEKCGEQEGGKTVEDSQKFHVLVRKYKEATCTAGAYYYYECETCGCTVAQIIDGKEVEVNGKKVTPIYHKDQKAELDRLNGNMLEDPDAKPAGHKYETKVQEPTLCEDGAILEVCKVCGDKKTVTTIKAEHSFTIELNPNDAPCSTYEKGAKLCDACRKAVDGKLKDAKDVKDCAVPKWNDQGAITGYGAGKFWVIGGQNTLNSAALPTNGYTLDGAQLPSYLNYEKGTFEQVTLALLAEWGFKLGDKTYVESTCVAPGYALIQCACGAIKTVVAPKTVGHDITASIKYPEDDPKVTATVDCTMSVVKNIKCNDCDYEATEVLYEGTEHKWVKTDEVVTATCNNMGSVKYVCENSFLTKSGMDECEAVKYEYTDKLAHTYGEWELTRGFCGNGTYTRWCSAGNHAETIIVTPDGPNVTPAGMKNTCEYRQVSYPATCKTPAYTQDECIYCGAVDETTRLDDQSGKLDPNNHEYLDVKNVQYTVHLENYNGTASNEWDRWTITIAANAVCDNGTENTNDDFETIEKILVAPGCFTKGSAIMLCTCGHNDSKTVELPALGHDSENVVSTKDTPDDPSTNEDEAHKFAYWTAGQYVGTFEYEDKDGNELEKTVVFVEQIVANTDNEVALAPTCQTVGYKNDGQICILCQAVTKAPTTLAKDPYNHIDNIVPAVTNDKVTMTFVGSVVTSNCREYSYVKVHTDCCGDSKQWTTDKTQDAVKAGWAGRYAYDKTAAKATNHDYEFVDAEASTCTEAGNHSYVRCAVCGYIDIKTIHRNDSDVISAMEGYSDWTQCGNTCPNYSATSDTAYDTVVETIQANGIVALELKDHTDVNVDGVDATCTTTGFVGFTYCTVCGTATLNGKTFDTGLGSETGLDLDGEDVDSVEELDDLADNTGADAAQKLAYANFAKFYQAIILQKVSHDYKKYDKAAAICGEYSIVPDFYAVTIKTDKDGNIELDSDGNPQVIEIKNDKGEYKYADGTSTLIAAGTAGEYCSVCGADKADPDATPTSKEPWKFVTSSVEGTWQMKVYRYIYDTWKVDNADLAKEEVTIDGETKTGLQIMKDWYAENITEVYDTRILNSKNELVNGHDYKIYFVNIYVPEGHSFENGETYESDVASAKEFALEAIKNGTDTLKSANCTEKSYVIVKCDGCGDACYLENPGDKYNVKTAHTWDTAEKNVLVQLEDDECVWAYCDVRKCKTCAFVETTQLSDEVMTHYTNNGVAGGELFGFDFSCTGYKNWLGKTCTACDKTFQEKDSKFYMGEVKEENEIKIAHNPSVTEKKETCSENGYKIEICKDCNAILSQTTIDLIKDGDHKAVMNGTTKVYDEYQAPTATANGYGIYTCTICGETVKDILTTNSVIDTVVTLNGDKFSAGNTVIATVYVSANALTFNKLYVTFDATGLVLDDANDVKSSFKNTCTGNVITLFVENDAEGNVVNTTLTADKAVLLTLEFTVANDAELGQELTISTSATKMDVWCTDAEECETLEKLQKADVEAKKEARVGHMHEDGATVPAVKLTDTPEAEKVTYTIVAPGNFNGDAFVGASDLQALLTSVDAVMAGKEIVNASMYDVDHSGEVNDDDFNALRKFIFNGLSAAAYTQMINDDVYAALDAYLASASAILPDLDDKVGTSAAEKLALVNAVKDYFDAPNSYEAFLAEYGDDSYADIFAAFAVQLEKDAAEDAAEDAEA